MSNKLMIIGLDGADWSLIKPWIKQGKLPTIRKMTNSGTSGPLRSTIPPLSAPAWTSAFTGVNPGKHNIFDFFKSEGYSLRLTNATDRKAKAVWEILSEKGFKVIVVNVPITYPPDKVNGIMISGKVGLAGAFLNRIGDYTYPSKIREKLSEIGYTLEKIPTKEEDYRLALEYIEIKRQVIMDFIQSQDWNLFIVVFTTPDHYQHFFWKHIHNSTEQSPYKDVILDIYRAIDKVLGDLNDLIGKNTDLILISDHGFGLIHKAVYINNLFEDLGLLRREKRKKIERGKQEILKEKLKDIFNQIAHRLPHNVKSPFKARFRRKELTINTVFEDFKSVDWSKTKAWLQHTQGVAINVRGRQPLGTVEPGEEYEKLRDYIIEKLYDLTDPENGEKVIKKVYKREEIYHGPYTKNFPDLVVEPKAEYLLQTQTFKERIFDKLKISGHHRPYGVFISYGPDIKKGYKIENAEIMDIAPTILHMMGITIPRAMDGKVLKRIFEKNSELYTKTVQYEDFKGEIKETIPKEIYTKEEEAEIKERLKRLGYI